MTNYEIRVDGMMCPHCKRTVEKVLSELPGVVLAVVDLERKTATVGTGTALDQEQVRSVIEAKDFKFVSMKTL